MGNRTYFVVLFALVLAILLASLLRPFGFNQWVVAGGIVVFYVWCKDVFSGIGWRKQRVAPHASVAEEYAHYQADYDDEFDADEHGRVDREYDFPAEELAALPELSAVERTGYQQLVDLCLPAEHQLEAAEFVGQLKDFSLDEGYPSTLDYVRDASDAEGWNFIMGLDWKASIYDLQFVLNEALRPHQLVVAWPHPSAYGPRDSVSRDGVFADFERPLRAQGLRLGFIDTDSDGYVFVLHREADAPRVSAAIEGIGYRYRAL